MKKLNLRWKISKELMLNRKEILLAWLLMSSITLYSKNNFGLLLSVGVNHNTIFTSPTLTLDTIFNPNGGSAKGFPSWGYYFGIFDKERINKIENLSIKFGIEYDLRTWKSEIDTGTAKLFNGVFSDPAYKFVDQSSNISLPVYFSYQYKKL